MSKHVNSIIQRYSDNIPGDPREQLRSISLRIDLEFMILLEALAEHIGKKKTPLLGEIAEAAIQEVYDSLSGDMEPGLVEMTERRLAEEVQNV